MDVVYGYAWMGVCLLLFLLMMYGVYSRGLFGPRPLVALTLAAALGWWLRVETYLLFLHVLSFDELERFFLLGATIFGTVLLIAYIFLVLALINLVFPRTLQAGDIFVLSGFAGLGVSLVTLIYGIGKVAGHEFGLF